jgi:cephalosporin-C deacetylase-like acetyl esterase
MVIVKRLLVAWAMMGVALGQQSHTPEQRYAMFQKNLERRGAAISARQLDGITNRSEWERRRPEIKRQFLEMLGLDPLPARTALNARITGGFEAEGYRVENIVFESQPGLYVTGNLYLPPAKGVYPAIVYVTGHSPHPAGAKINYQHHGAWFARHGFVAFVLDTIEFGEIAGIHHGTHNLEMWEWLSLGYNPAGVEVWNAMRALDYLETRPEVDRTKAGITGRSGGGAVSWFTAAADERFQVAAPVHGSWSIGAHVKYDTVRENCDCIYFWNTYQLDLPVVGALIAPRPLQIVNATKDDSFPPTGYRPVYEFLQTVYGWYDAKAKVAAFEAETGHEDTPVYRKAANEWLNHWLRNDTTPYVEEPGPNLPAEKLTVLSAYPPNANNEGIHRLFIPTMQPQTYTTAAAWERRREELLQLLRTKTFRAFPADTVPFDTWRRADNGWTARYADTFRVEFATEEDIRVTGKLFVPRDGKASHPALLYVKGKDDIVYDVDYDNLLSAFPHHVVLVLHPRGTDYPMNNFRMASTKMTAALLGGTLESMQLWDVLQGVRFLGETGKIDGVSVYGRRQMGGLALHAAALDQQISRVILDDPPGSHWQGPALLGVLRFTDLAEVAAMVAPREIVSLTPWPRAFDYTRSIFGLYRATGKMRQARSLGEALEVWKTP